MKLEKTVMFVGIPWSWKSTQSQILSEITWVRRIWMGELLREESKVNTELQTLMNASFELPYETAFSLAKWIFIDHWKTPLILDWFYRSPWNFDAVKKYFPNFQIVYLQVGCKTAVQRILSGQRERIDDRNYELIRKRIQNDITKIQHIVGRDNAFCINWDQEKEKVTQEILKKIIF
jgi:adenylate kinase family enzyme